MKAVLAKTINHPIKKKQNTFHDSPLSLLCILLTGHLAHTSLAYFLKNLVMAVGRADHEIPLTVKYSYAQGYA